MSRIYFGTLWEVWRGMSVVGNVLWAVGNALTNGSFAVRESQNRLFRFYWREKYGEELNAAR